MHQVVTILLGTAVALISLLTVDLYQEVHAVEHKNEVQNGQIIDLMANQEIERQIFQAQLEQMGNK